MKTSQTSLKVFFTTKSSTTTTKTSIGAVDEPPNRTCTDIVDTPLTSQTSIEVVDKLTNQISGDSIGSPTTGQTSFEALDESEDQTSGDTVDSPDCCGITDNKIATNESHDVLKYLVWLVWTCLSLTPGGMKNAVFATIIPTQDVLEELVTRSSVVMSVGFLSVVRAATPPTLSFFKSLPTITTRDAWAVYVLVLEKAGCRPVIYIGSGTDKDRGVAGRFYDYKHIYRHPLTMRMLTQSGYTITHKGCLCWSPIPPLNEQYRFRLFFVAIEAAFSILFWAMKSRTKDYYMPNLCPWSLDTVEYDGCCSHIALKEGPRGPDQDLTLEQLTALEVARVAHNRTVRLAAVRRIEDNNRATRRHVCNYCNVVFKSTTEENNHNITEKHLNNVKGITKQTVAKDTRNRAWAEGNKASRRFTCDLCGINTPTKAHLNSHFKTKKHARNVATAKAEAAAAKAA